MVYKWMYHWSSDNPWPNHADDNIYCKCCSRFTSATLLRATAGMKMNERSKFTTKRAAWLLHVL